MTPEQWHHLREAFKRALEEPAERRAEFVERLRGDNPELAVGVERLLQGAQSDSADLSHFAERAAGSRQAAPRFLDGQILADRFRVIHLLSRGGMGEVYEAEDFALGEHVAIKTILPEIAEDADALAMFKREIQLARRVTHPNVCRIHDLIQHEGASLVSMELVRGVTLRDHLMQHGPLSEQAAMPLIEQMAGALQAAHDAGVIHRDFKPSNVMLETGDGQLRAVVTDFGLAIPALDTVKETGTRHGTLSYMAPEQLRGDPVTPATDVYGLGRLIREMTGNPPPRWEPILVRTQAEDPAKRYDRPQTLSAELRRALGGRAVLRRIWIAAGAVMMAALLGAAVFWDGPRSTTPSLPAPVVASAVAPAAITAATATGEPEQAIVLPQGSWLLVGAFENRSEEPELDSILKVGLEWELSQSGSFRLADADRIADTLRLMKKAPNTRLDRALAREVCLRDGGIAILVTGHAERTADGYELTVELVDPVTDRTLATHSENEKDRTRLQLAIQGLRNWVLSRQELVDAEPANSKPERVTTPSLEALRWFGQADAAARIQDWDNAAKLNRRALAADPSFASAHLWLAFALKNRQRPEWEYELQRARELAPTASERERLFIEGGDSVLRGQMELAEATLKELIRRYPDHYFGHTNLANIYSQLGREQESVDALARIADLRPNDAAAQQRVALQMRTIDPRRAVQYARRALTLIDTDVPNVTLRDQPTYIGMRQMVFQDAWTTDGRAARAELDGLAREWSRYDNSPLRETFVTVLVFDYMGLGRTADAKKWAQRAERQDCLMAAIFYWSGNLDGAREAAERPKPGGDDNCWTVKVRLSSSYAMPVGLPEVYYAAQIAFREDRLGEGIDGIRNLTSPLALDMEQAVLESLGRALDRAKDQGDATAFFKGRVPKAWVGPRPAFWIRNQVQLLHIYRASGRTSEAHSLEKGLQKRLNAAEPDFYLLKEIRSER